MGNHREKVRRPEGNFVDTSGRPNREHGRRSEGTATATDKEQDSMMSSTRREPKREISNLYSKDEVSHTVSAIVTTGVQ